MMNPFGPEMFSPLSQKQMLAEIARLKRVSVRPLQSRKVVTPKQHKPHRSTVKAAYEREIRREEAERRR